MDNPIRPFRQPSLWHASGIALWNPVHLIVIFSAWFVWWVLLQGLRWVGVEEGFSGLTLALVCMGAFVTFTMALQGTALRPLELKAKQSFEDLARLIPVSQRRRVATEFFSISFISFVFIEIPVQLLILGSPSHFHLTAFNVWLLLVAVHGIIDFTGRVLRPLRVIGWLARQSVLIGIIPVLLFHPDFGFGVSNVFLLEPIVPMVYLSGLAVLAWGGSWWLAGITLIKPQSPAARPKDVQRLTTTRLVSIPGKPLILRLHAQPESSLGFLTGLTGILILLGMLVAGYGMSLATAGRPNLSAAFSLISLVGGATLSILGLSVISWAQGLVMHLHLLPTHPMRLVSWIHLGCLVLPSFIGAQMVIGNEGAGTLVVGLIILLLSQLVVLYVIRSSSPVVQYRSGSLKVGLPDAAATLLSIGLPVGAMLLQLNYIDSAFLILPALIIPAILNVWLMYVLWRRT